MVDRLRNNRMRSSLVAAVAALALTLIGGISGAVSSHAQERNEPPRPLEGKVILLDPGHQLGNSNPKFAQQMGQKKFNGTTTKGCNTTGTATNAGFPEATFNWKVAKQLKKLLQAQGARVELTRDSNSRDAWGPCVWDRGLQAQRVGADIMVNIHADGSASKNRGFFVIAPGKVKGWTEDIVKPSRTLAQAMIKGMTKAGAPPSNYIRQQLMVSTNTSGVNFSDVPAVTVELGNMRNRTDARLMSSASGQRAYAVWLAAGISRYFS